MNQSKYLVFLKTVELGSITRAAEALGYTQSAVSRVVAELEREYILQRQRQGIALAKEQGKYRGRRPLDPPELKKVVRQWRAGELTARQAMRKLDLSSSTFYRKARGIS